MAAGQLATAAAKDTAANIIVERIVSSKGPKEEKYLRVGLKQGDGYMYFQPLFWDSASTNSTGAIHSVPDTPDHHMTCQQNVMDVACHF